MNETFDPGPPLPPPLMANKRKRDDDDSLTLQLASAPSLGPLLGIFPALQAPNDTPFKYYTPTKAGAGSDMVVGEASQVEFISNEEESTRAADSGCGYVLAIRNGSKLKLLATQNSPFILTRTVKALKSILPADEPTSLAFREARTALGETFGTKKAKAAIRAQERNRVDVGAMQGVMQHVVEGIDEKAGGLLTQEDAKELADSARLIPPFSSTATEPAKVYPLNEMIPDSELKALDIAPVQDSIKNNGSTAGILPWKFSKWINNHLKRIGQQEKNRKARKQKFRPAQGLDKNTVYEKMNNVPTIVVDGLLSRFTETTRGSSVHIFTSAMSTKLLAYLLALCLHVDDFTSDPKMLADDLSMSLTSIQSAYKNLGCKLKTLTEHQLSTRGLSDTLGHTKFAVLVAPVVFPKVRTGKGKRT
ncbi:hypothetical protein D9757_003204 [Collybiopsis confluens]|uniref:Rpa49 subunit specific to nuclear RNA polymerase I n=1 Tax=Collybiopsis confluens TaxID=2823264 RepID=A0A8H5HYY3_9AGAR|nr:hypothetical protein D9757_003204 [Collybiopsis confluens]